MDSCSELELGKRPTEIKLCNKNLYIDIIVIMAKSSYNVRDNFHILWPGRLCAVDSGFTYIALWYIIYENFPKNQHPNLLSLNPAMKPEALKKVIRSMLDILST